MMIKPRYSFVAEGGQESIIINKNQNCKATARAIKWPSTGSFAYQFGQQKGLLVHHNRGQRVSLDEDPPETQAGLIRKRIPNDRGHKKGCRS